ncbi:MAG TPA: ExeM/NucH family extracellular endonuclease, partial [Chitinophagaceae bacterium]|nr:ExeM/NucH family extracellular endonuclease [Chitinophagaceae bacterium]
FAMPTFTYAVRPALPSLTGNLKIASFNVLNYFNGNGSGGGFPTSRGANSLVEFNRQRDKIISALSQMNADIVGLLEIENDGTGAASAMQDLVNGLNAVMGAGTYAFINDGAATQAFNTDEIRAGIIYKPGAVTPVGLPMTTDNNVFERPPLAQTFRLKGISKEFTYIINHFKSKGGCPAASTAPNPNLEQGDGQSCWNERRKQQAEALVSFINTVVIPTSGNDRVLSMGDYNAYYEEDPMDVFRANKLVVLGSATSYSYLFDQQLGSLDHAVATASMNDLLTGFAKWNINSVEPAYLDYNDAVRDGGEGNGDVNPWAGLYSTQPYRSSDHDAVIASFTINKSSDIRVSKQATEVVTSGGVIDYTITLANDGPDEAENVVLKDVIPTGTTYVSLVAPEGWTISTPQPGASGLIQVSRPVLSKTMGDQRFTLKVKASCELANATVITNEASVTSMTEEINSNNNLASATTSVNASVPVVNIPDANSLHVGVLPNTVYPGYAPATTLSLNAQVTGGTGSYNYSWSNGSVNPVTAVSPEAPATYTVTVTDMNGCSGSASKLVNVIDVRAGRKGDKVAICHKPAKQQSNLEVGSSDVMNHLLHGDMLGTCLTDNELPALLAKISIIVYPNPSNNYFIINLSLKGDHMFTVIVRDIFGKTIETKKDLQPGQALKLGAEYRPGLYFVELIQGKDRQILKLIKQ